MKDYIGALRNPKYIREYFVECYLVARRVGIWPAFGYALDRLVGVNPPALLARLRGRNPTVCAPVHAFPGARMHLDWNDKGISRDLLCYGTREDAAGRFFRDVLRPGQIVVDAGANIGWYVLMEAAAVGPEGRVLAIEPAPRNFELLRQNVLLNGFDDRVSLAHAALGAESGTATLHLASRSNLHTVRRTSQMDAYVSFFGTVEVPMFTLDELVLRHGIRPRDVNIVRMDVEGFEVDVFAGMRRILSEAEDLVLFVELHPKLIKEAHGEEGYHRFLDSLKEEGFEVLASADSLDSRRDRTTMLALDDLYSGHEAVELLFKRQPHRVGTA